MANEGFKASLEFINALFNISHLVLLVLILMTLAREKSRGDRLEESNRHLQDRFIKFMLQLPPNHGLKIDADAVLDDLHKDADLGKKKRRWV